MKCWTGFFFIFASARLSRNSRVRRSGAKKTNSNSVWIRAHCKRWRPLSIRVVKPNSKSKQTPLGKWQKQQNPAQHNKEHINRCSSMCVLYLSRASVNNSETSCFKIAQEQLFKAERREVLVSSVWQLQNVLPVGNIYA